MRRRAARPGMYNRETALMTHNRETTLMKSNKVIASIVAMIVIMAATSEWVSLSTDDAGTGGG